MESERIDELREAYETLVRGDSEPLVALLDPHVHWRGVPHGLWWRRATPFWHGIDEARAVLQTQIRSLRAASVEPPRVSVEVVPGASEQVLVGFHFVRGRDRYQVLNLREGRIVHMQDYERRREALQAAGIAA